MRILNQQANLNTEYSLQATEKGVSFIAFRSDTASATNPETARKNEEINAECRGYFLRKGFSRILKEVESDVATPIYKDNEGNEIHPESTKQALDLIHDGQANISGFTFGKKVPEDQKEAAFAKMLKVFIETSQNSDLANAHNKFMVGMSSDLLASQTSWTGGAKVSGEGILEKLDLMPDGIQARKDYRQALQNRSISSRGQTL